jgi:ribosomal protein L16 Arg81 hydroxylase
MPTTSTLQRILNPVSLDEFIEQWFQRRPLRVRGAQGKFDFLFAASDFPLRLDKVEEIKAVFPKNRQQRIDPVDIKLSMENGATICINGMERAHPKLRRAARLIRSELSYAGIVDFRAYLSPPGHGFDLHFDARVATTLQIAGTKRWWFSSEPAVRFPLENSSRSARSRAQYRIPKLSTLQSVLLRPGDVLCLPAGVWHCAKAKTMSLALNMAFDHYGAGVFDSIVSVLERRLMRDIRWREPLPVARRGNGRHIPVKSASVLRERIDALQLELSKLREDEAALERAWRTAVRSRPRS